MCTLHEHPFAVDEPLKMPAVLHTAVNKLKKKKKSKIISKRNEELI